MLFVSIYTCWPHFELRLALFVELTAGSPINLTLHRRDAHCSFAYVLQDNWSPALTTSKVLLSIGSLLTDANPGMDSWASSNACLSQVKFRSVAYYFREYCESWACNVVMCAFLKDYVGLILSSLLCKAPPHIYMCAKHGTKAMTSKVLHCKPAHARFVLYITIFSRLLLRNRRLCYRRPTGRRHCTAIQDQQGTARQDRPRMGPALCEMSERVHGASTAHMVHPYTHRKYIETSCFFKLERGRC